MAYETTEQLLAEISDYWDKRPQGNVYKLIDAFNAPLEAISGNAYKVERWRALQDAKGTTLDLFGSDIETYRPDSDDENYKFLIHLMELLSRAQGTIPSIYKISSNALDNDEHFKIWQTGIRHIGIQIPFDSIGTPQMQRFLLSNLRKMLAMGYWIDEIKFVSTSHLKLYAGLGSQEKSYESHYSKMKWWTGWKAKADCPFYVGVVGSIVKTTTYKSKLKWSDDQKEEIHAGLTIGNKTITTTTQSIKTE